MSSKKKSSSMDHSKGCSRSFDVCKNTKPTESTIQSNKKYFSEETPDVSKPKRETPSFMEVAYMNDPQRLFESLIAPYSVAEFFTSYWEKQPLFIKRDDPTYFDGLYSRSDFFTEIEKNEVDCQNVAKGESSTLANNTSSSLMDTTEQEAEPVKPLLFGTHLNVVVYNGKRKVNMNPHQNFTAVGAPLTMRAILKALRGIRKSSLEAKDKSKKSKKNKSSSKASNDPSSSHFAEVDAFDVDIGDEDSFTYDDPELEAKLSRDNDVSYAQRAFKNLTRAQIMEKIQEDDEYLEKTRSRITLREVADLLKVGCTLQVIHPQQRSTSVWRVLYLLESYFGSLVGANSYITPGGSQGLSPHHDDVDVYVCQLEGTKSWKLYPPVDPLAQTCAEVPRSALSKGVTVTLSPGDFLYLPRGTIHEAIADVNDEFSHHVTISSSQTSSWFHLLQIALQASLASPSNLSLRQSLPFAAPAFTGTLHDKDISVDYILGSSSNQPENAQPDFSDDAIGSVDMEEYQRLLAEQNSKPLSTDMEDMEDVDEDNIDEDMMGDVCQDEDEDEDEDLSTNMEDNISDIHDQSSMGSSKGNGLEDIDPQFTSTDLPYSIISDADGSTNWPMFYRYASADQTKFLRFIRQGNVSERSQSLLEQVLQNVDIHAAMDELQRDFALHRLPPPPPLSMDPNVVDSLHCDHVKDIIFQEIQAEVNHSDLTGVLSAKPEDTLNDAFDVIAKIDLYSAIRLKNLPDLLITVEPTPMPSALESAHLNDDDDDNEDDLDSFDGLSNHDEDEDEDMNIFEEIEEDHLREDMDSESDSPNPNIKDFDMGNRKLFTLSSKIKNNHSNDFKNTPKTLSKTSKNSSHLPTTTTVIDDDEVEHVNENENEDEDEDGHGHLEADNTDVFDYQLQQLASLPEHHLHVAVYSAHSNDRASHMGIGSTKLGTSKSKLGQTASDEHEEPELDAMQKAFSHTLWGDEDIKGVAGVGEDEDEDGHGHGDEDEDGHDHSEDDLRAQFDIPLKSVQTSTPFSFPIATLPAFRQLLNNHTSFTHVGDLDINWDICRRFKASFDLMTPFDLMGANPGDGSLPSNSEDEDDSEDLVMQFPDDTYLEDSEDLENVGDFERLGRLSNKTTSTQPKYHQPNPQLLGPLCERIRTMILHWFTADLYAKGLIEIVLNGDDARALNKQEKKVSQNYISEFHLPYEGEEDGDEDEDEDDGEDAEDDQDDENENSVQFVGASKNSDFDYKTDSRFLNLFAVSSDIGFTVDETEWDPSKLPLLHRIHDTIYALPRLASAASIMRKVNEESTIQKFASKNGKTIIDVDCLASISHFIPKDLVLRAMALFASKVTSLIRINTAVENNGSDSANDVIEVNTDDFKKSSLLDSDNDNDNDNDNDSDGHAFPANLFSSISDGFCDIQENSLRMLLSGLHGNQLNSDWQSVMYEDEDEEDLLEDEDGNVFSHADLLEMVKNGQNPFVGDEDEDEDGEDGEDQLRGQDEDLDASIEDEDGDEDDDANAYDKMSARTRRILQQAYEEEQAQLAMFSMEDEDEDGLEDEDLLENVGLFEDLEDNEDLEDVEVDSQSNSQSNLTTNSHKKYDLYPLYGKNKSIVHKAKSVPKVNEEEFLLIQKKAPSADLHEANQALLFEKLAKLISNAPRKGTNAAPVPSVPASTSNEIYGKSSNKVSTTSITSAASINASASKDNSIGQTNSSSVSSLKRSASGSITTLPDNDGPAKRAKRAKQGDSQTPDTRKPDTYNSSKRRS